MEESSRKKFITDLQKVERKYQQLHNLARKLKNPDIVATLFEMESGTRRILRELESGKSVSEKEIKNAVKGVFSFEPKIKEHLDKEKDLDALADAVDKAFYVYSSHKNSIPQLGDLSDEYIRRGDALQMLSRNIMERDERNPKAIKKEIDAFNNVMERVMGAIKERSR